DSRRRRRLPALTWRAADPKNREVCRSRAALSSRGLGHGPFKAATRVRIPSGSLSLFAKRWKTLAFPAFFAFRLGTACPAISRTWRQDPNRPFVCCLWGDSHASISFAGVERLHPIWITRAGCRLKT